MLESRWRIENLKEKRAALTSFIVLNWNGRDAVLECIQSVREQRGEPVECIVVDNGSTDKSLGSIRSSFPEIHVVQIGRNIGFAAGMNHGMRLARGDIVVPTNQDVVFAPDFAAEVRKIMNRDETVAAVGGPLYRFIDGRKSSELDAGGYFLAGRIAARIVKPVHGETEVFGVSGACPSFRYRDLVLIELQPGEFFDEDYFAYFEDIDLFFRLQLLGKRVVYTDRVTAWHHRSQSIGGGRRFFERPVWIQRHHFRNRYLTLIKNLPLANAVAVLPRFLVAEILTIPFLMVRSPRSLFPLIQAWYDVTRSVPRTIRKRRLVQSRRRVHGDAISRFIRGI